MNKSKLPNDYIQQLADYLNDLALIIKRRGPVYCTKGLAKRLALTAKYLEGANDD